MATDFFIVIAAGFCGGVLARLLGQPLVLGYLLAGIVVGPHTGGITVGDPQNLERLAEIGVTLLLFGLGLELSLADLRPVRRVAIIGAPLQVIATIGLGVPLGRWLGFGWTESIWFGSLVSLSSTIIVLKALQAQGRMGTLSSRVMIGMLVVQDLTFIPLMVLLPSLTGGAGGSAEALLAIAKAGALLAVLLVGGTRVLPRFVGWVARSGSRELFLLVTMSLALGIGYLAHAVGVGVGCRRVRRGPRAQRVRLQPPGAERHHPAAGRLQPAVLRLGRHAARPGTGARRLAHGRRGRRAGQPAEGRDLLRHHLDVRVPQRGAAGDRAGAVSSR